MNKLFSVAILLATIVSLFSCERDTGKNRLKVMVKENGVDWSVMERLVGDSPIDLTSEGNPCFLIGGIPFYASIHSDGVIGIRQDIERGADSLSFADFLSVDYSLYDAFGLPKYSGDRDLFMYGNSFDRSDRFSKVDYSNPQNRYRYLEYLESLGRDNKGVDSLSLEHFYRLNLSGRQDDIWFEDQPAIRKAISFATDFELASIYVPVEDTAILIGYHSSFNGVMFFCFGEALR